MVVTIGDMVSGDMIVKIVALAVMMIMMGFLLSKEEHTWESLCTARATLLRTHDLT